MREGPVVIQTSYRSCIGCRFWDHHMVKSGFDPIYENSCKNPDAGPSGDVERLLGFGTHGRHIGRSDVTPDWCPIITGSNHE